MCTFTGVLGIKVKIMLPHDPTGKSGPKKPLPDQVSLNYVMFTLLSLCLPMLYLHCSLYLGECGGAQRRTACD